MKINISFALKEISKRISIIAPSASGQVIVHIPVALHNILDLTRCL